MKELLRLAGDTVAMRAFALLKIPMIAYLWPRIIESSDKRSEIVIPLTWRSKNHLGSMYFGALAVGADLAVGLPVVRFSREMAKGKKLSFLFKDARFNFLKRAEGDVHFICEECDKAAAMFRQCEETGERHDATLRGYALVPSQGPDPVAEFWLTLSARVR